MRIRSLTQKNGIICLLTLLLLIRAEHAVAEKLSFSTVEDSDIFTHYALAILQQAYSCVGPYEIEIKYYPAKRALLYANMGQFDGELIRPPLGNQYPNLIKVDIPLFKYELAVIFKSSSAVITPDLSNLTQSRIGIINGHQSTAYLSNTLPNVFKARDLTHLIKLLNNQRIDYAIVIDEILEKRHMQELQKYKPLNGIKWFYHYIHKRHSELVPALTKCLSKMKKTNQFLNIINEVKRNKSQIPNMNF